MINYLRLLNAASGKAFVLSLLLLTILSSCQSFAPLSQRVILPTQVSAKAPHKLVFLGASGEYGTGCFDPEYQSYVSLLGMYLYFQNLPYEVINAGIPGDTTSGVLDRMDQYLNDETAMIFLHIGGNDIGLTTSPFGPYPPIEDFQNSLREIVERITKRGIPLVIVRNNIPEATPYLHKFVASFDSIAKEYQLAIVDYWPPGVMFVPGMQIPDGHANENGHRRIAAHFLRQLNPAFMPSEEELTVSNEMVRLMPWFEHSFRQVQKAESD